LKAHDTPRKTAIGIVMAIVNGNQRAAALDDGAGRVTALSRGTCFTA
jgi:hypothetical protein